MDSLKSRHCKEKDGGGSPGGVRGGRGGVRGGGRFGCSDFLLLFGGGPPLYPVGFEPGAVAQAVWQAKRLSSTFPNKLIFSTIGVHCGIPSDDE